MSRSPNTAPCVTVCSICDRPVQARGWCERHYKRFWRHGDPLGGRNGPPPRGEPMRFLREVAAHHDGLSGCLEWPFSRRSKGYGGVHANGRKAYAARVVCEIVKGPAPSPAHEAAHSCGRGHLGCVSGAHVRWATPKENAADKIQHGTQPRGEKHPRAKLTVVDVQQLRAACRAGLTQRSLSRRFGIHFATVWGIVHGNAWTHVPPKAEELS
jgi:hypothetical protein